MRYQALTNAIIIYKKNRTERNASLHSKQQSMKICPANNI